MADLLNEDRIRKMIAAVSKAAEGDYTARIDADVVKNDDLASLAGAINSMLEASGKQISNIQQCVAGFRQVVEAVNDALAVGDADGVLTYANQHFCEMLGGSAEELLGRRFVDLLDEANRTIGLEQQEKRKQGISTSCHLEISARLPANNHRHTP
jgi:PAS domain-containing protein